MLRDKISGCRVIFFLISISAIEISRVNAAPFENSTCYECCRFLKFNIHLEKMVWKLTTDILLAKMLFLKNTVTLFEEISLSKPVLFLIEGNTVQPHSRGPLNNRADV